MKIGAGTSESTAKKSTVKSKKTLDAREAQDASMLVAEESCLGYIYPKKIESQLQRSSSYVTSRLGQLTGLSHQDRLSQKRIPHASNLEKLMTYPSKIIDKYGATVGYQNVKYPRSIYLERYLRQRSALSTVNLLSSRSRAHYQTEYSDSGEGADNGDDGEQAKPTFASKDDVTPKQTALNSPLDGWNQVSVGEDPDESVPRETVETRVGGAVFIKTRDVSKEEPPSLTETQPSLEQPPSQAKGKNKKRYLKNNSSLPAVKKKKRSVGGTELNAKKFGYLQPANRSQRVEELEDPL